MNPMYLTIAMVIFGSGVGRSIVKNNVPSKTMRAIWGLVYSVGAVALTMGIATMSQRAEESIANISDFSGLLAISVFVLATTISWATTDLEGL